LSYEISGIYENRQDVDEKEVGLSGKNSKFVLNMYRELYS